MPIETLMQRAIKIINKKDFKIISDQMVQVKSNKKIHTVTYKTLPGRTIQTCSCTNFSRHCKQPIRCVDMLVAEWVLMLKQLNQGGKKQ